MNSPRFITVAIALAFAIGNASAQTYNVGAVVANTLHGLSNSSYTNPASAGLASGSSAYAFGTSTTLGANAATAGGSGDSSTGSALRTVDDWTIGAPIGSGGTTTTGGLWMHMAGSLASDSGYGVAEGTLLVQVVDISAATPTVVFDASVYFEQEGAGGWGIGSIPYIGQTVGTAGSPEFDSFIQSATSNYTNYGGAIASLSAGIDVYTDPITWTAGDTYNVTFGLTAFAESDSTQSVGDSALFADPFSLAADHTVLDLPTGWTVNSPDSHVTNNSFAATPEPQTPTVLAFGVLGLLLARRRRTTA